MKSDDLDVLTRARDYLAELDELATDGPWRAEYSREQGNCVLPPDAVGTREAVAVTRLLPQAFDAELIAALRACAPYLIDRLDAAIRDCQAVGIWQDQSAELDLARAILEATERNES